MEKYMDVRIKWEGLMPPNISISLIKRLLNQEVSGGKFLITPLPESLSDDEIRRIIMKIAHSNTTTLPGDIDYEQFDELVKALSGKIAKPVEEKKCCCGEIETLGVVHRKDKPCYVAEPPKAELPDRISWSMLEALNGEDMVLRKLVDKFNQLRDYLQATRD